MTSSKYFNKLGPFMNIRYVISTIAVFMALWAMITMCITALWYVIPIGSLELMHSIRWIISLIILWILIKKGNILINK